MVLPLLFEHPWVAVALGYLILCLIMHLTLHTAQVDTPPASPIRLPNDSNELTLNNRTIPLSVNYHFTRKCNYACGFCFHTDTNSYIASFPDAKEALLRLSQAGMKKVNFAGGEPFLYPSMLGKMVDYCKQELRLESVSIVSNGSKITESWIRAHAANLDILAISCDSFDERTNVIIGRGEGTHITQLYRVTEWCREYGVMFKLNSVICKYNFDEDMNEHIARLQPYRWKCFQVLVVPGENDSCVTKRDARGFQISDDEFQLFCKNHAAQTCIVPESNQVMASSYLILDEHLRFLDKSCKKPSASILEVGVQQALDSVFWDMDGFKERGGVYAWNESLVQEQMQNEMDDNVLVDRALANKDDTAEELDREMRKLMQIQGAFDMRSQIMGGAACGAGAGAGEASESSADMEDIGKKAKKD
ncbi:uncharacterized protein A1O9_09102 [Exophiala aquamarina CBS 119918]|uniref:Radical SAM core domain-containing protein n=1 Tax=Exophiala aquamarina CBS 119918 TaxID=1182545 RepID=A0A072PGI4_9EURO|nr:uncharacterized protein A1O9_09102 [Exophiala aquamarina CBS 119918]KEF54660.1 hypothetical protein A1O9_09102 [Exophiala aquamarina CBS 119918]